MSMLRQQLLDTTRGRIVTLLQKGPLTVDEIAAKLRLTTNAVRVQITGMERDGVVRRSGRRAGTTRPPNVYELTAEVEQLLSRAYIPLLTQVIRLCIQGPFTPETAPDGLKDLLARAGEMPDFERLQGELRRTLAEVAGLFDTVVA